MNLYEFGLAYLKKNAPQYKILDPDIGIVTATDHNTFIGVKTLYLSVKDKINFVCYDLGLTEEDLRWCKDNNLRTIKFINNTTDIDKWQTYLKPFLIKESPYDYTIWIDSDCIVTGDLSKSEIIQNKETFFTRHWINEKFLKKNNEKLYELYPVSGKSDYINAGVFGLNKLKDSNILDEWILMTNVTLQNETIRNYVVNWDEGSLLWAIRKTNNGNKIIDDNSKYNFYTEFSGTTLAYEKDIKTFYDRPTEQLTDCVIPSVFFKKILKGNGLIRHFSTCMKNQEKYWNKWN